MRVITKMPSLLGISNVLAKMTMIVAFGIVSPSSTPQSFEYNATSGERIHRIPIDSGCIIVDLFWSLYHLGKKMGYCIADSSSTNLFFVAFGF